MAAPNPETDPGLPRRTAFQSPLANSTTASGEAPVTAAADLQPKRPDPFAKPVIRTAPAPKPAEAPAPPATAAAAPATTGADTADWGRALKPRSGTSLKFKIASLVGLVAAAGGGYFGYQKYLKPNADKAQAESAADQTEESTDDENLYSSKDLDPFAEEVVKMAGNESIDELEAE
ncbi:MAG: hypothetical protein JSS02_04855, partial [Planctomycetes bacterium]|nr:hypothetical protein [Planctomycetota bacterium]